MYCSVKGSLIISQSRFELFCTISAAYLAQALLGSLDRRNRVLSHAHERLDAFVVVVESPGDVLFDRNFLPIGANLRQTWLIRPQIEPISKFCESFRLVGGAGEARAALSSLFLIVSPFQQFSRHCSTILSLSQVISKRDCQSIGS